MDENEILDGSFEEEEELDPVAEDEPDTEEPEVAGEGEDDGGEGEDSDGEGEDAPDRVSELESQLAAEREKSGKSDADLKRLLKALGFDDVDSYLAEQEGISRDEFLEKQRDAELLAQAKAQAENAKYEDMARKDLAELKSLGLVDSSITHLSQIANAKRFCELRENAKYKGFELTVEEAYRAAAGSKLDSRIEQGARRAASGKEHLTTPKSRGTAGHGSVMSESTKAYYREILGTDDDKAIENAYRRAAASMK